MVTKNPNSIFWCQRGIEMPDERHDDRGKSSIQGARRPGRYAGSLDSSVECPMEVSKALIVGSVARLMQIQYSYDETTSIMVTAYAARRLNVFGGRFRLALNEHQAETRDIQTNGDHVGRERNIDGLVSIVEAGFETLFGFRDLVG